MSYCFGKLARRKSHSGVLPGQRNHSRVLPELLAEQRNLSGVLTEALAGQRNHSGVLELLAEQRNHFEVLAELLALVQAEPTFVAMEQATVTLPHSCREDYKCSRLVASSKR